MREDRTVGGRDNDQVMNDVITAVRDTNLTDEQNEFVNGALMGVYAATATLERFPGSDKAYTLAFLVTVLQRFECKVMIVTQPTLRWMRSLSSKSLAPQLLP